MFGRRSKITFIRHGSTINTEQNRLSDNEDFPPLNEAGRLEMEKLAAWLIQRSPKTDRVYTGAALCTVQSAKIIAKAYKLNFEVLDNLQTRRLGCWSGLTPHQIQAKYPDESELFRGNKATYRMEGGESLLDFDSRVNPVIQSLIEQNIGKRIIIVTHSDVIQSAIAQALEIPVQNQENVYITTGSASQISYYNDFSSLVYSGYLPL